MGKKNNISNKKVGAVLVTGGGIGGIQASLDLAESGFKVYLLDNKPSIGGRMAQLDKTFPTNDCAMCILAPKLVTAGRHTNIDLITYADIEKIEGEVGNFRVKIRKRARSIDESKCTGCGECMAVCLVRNQPQIRTIPSIRKKLERKKLQKLDRIIDRYAHERGALIQVLQDINVEYNYLPANALRYVSERLNIPLSQVYHVATFYTAFSLEPRGKHIIRVCLGTACHARGAPRILEELERKLEVSAGETTKDLQFTLETVNCLGCCALGPVVVVDDDYHSAMSPDKIDFMLKKYISSG